MNETKKYSSFSHCICKQIILFISAHTSITNEIYSDMQSKFYGMRV